MSSSVVTSMDGTRIAVRERGDPAGPIVLCVHGYPDNSAVWDGVAGELAADHRVVTYDVRGAGSSDRPKRTVDYRLELLADDLRAVIDGLGRPAHEVHLVAHDWGSIQVWHALRRGLTAASFTSISGPDLEQARSRMSHRQRISSSYILFFLVPLVPELAVRTRLLSGVIRLLDRSRGGHRIDPDDARHGLKLYRANMFRRIPPGGPVGTPVQVIVPTRDPFVGARVQMVDNAVVKTVREGHWVPVRRPHFVAECVREFTRATRG